MYLQILGLITSGLVAPKLRQYWCSKKALEKVEKLLIKGLNEQDKLNCRVVHLITLLDNEELKLLSEFGINKRPNLTDNMYLNRLNIINNFVKIGGCSAANLFLKDSAYSDALDKLGNNFRKNFQFDDFQTFESTKKELELLKLVHKFGDFSSVDKKISKLPLYLKFTLVLLRLIQMQSIKDTLHHHWNF